MGARRHGSGVVRGRNFFLAWGRTDLWSCSRPRSRLGRASALRQCVAPRVAGPARSRRFRRQCREARWWHLVDVDEASRGRGDPCERAGHRGSMTGSEPAVREKPCRCDESRQQQGSELRRRDGDPAAAKALRVLRNAAPGAPAPSPGLRISAASTPPARCRIHPQPMSRPAFDSHAAPSRRSPPDPSAILLLPGQCGVLDCMNMLGKAGLHTDDVDCRFQRFAAVAMPAISPPRQPQPAGVSSGTVPDPSPTPRPAHGFVVVRVDEGAAAGASPGSAYSPNQRARQHDLGAEAAGAFHLTLGVKRASAPARSPSRCAW